MTLFQSMAKTGLNFSGTFGNIPFFPTQVNYVPIINLTRIGSAWNDFLPDGRGSDTLIGHDGNDSLVGEYGNDSRRAEVSCPSQ